MGQDFRTGPTPRSTPRFGAAVAQLWHTLVKDLFDPYHPEQHYMRGPGPKWRAKHAYPTPASRRPA